jgi:fucose permease
MPADPHATPSSKAMIWVGRIISALIVLFLLFGGVMNLTKSAQVIDAMKHFEYPEGLSLGLGITMIACAIIYAIPQTAVLGAILLTGYLGGATATHLRVGEPFFFPVLFGMLVWLGPFLRDARLRALLPLRR